MNATVKSDRVAVRLAPGQRAKVERVAAQIGGTFSDALRQLIDRAHVRTEITFQESEANNAVEK